MLTENTVTKLQEMRLSAMASAFKEQMTDPNMAGVPFEDRAKNAARAPFARKNRATVPEVRASPYSGKNSMLKYNRHTGV
jgi:hypothetical protein